MRKLLFLLVFIVVSTVLWAAGVADPPPRFIDIGGDYSFISESGSIQGATAQVKTHSAGPSLAFTSKSSKTSRWYTSVNMSFHFPFYQTAKMSGKEISIPMDSYDSYFMYLMNLGFLYSFVETPKFVLAAGPAINFMLVSINAKSASTLGFYLGPGITIKGNFFFSDRVYLGLGLIAAYNPIAYTTVFSGYGSKTSFGIVSNFSIQPRLSIGYKF